jgi:hypothetical protein
MVKPYKQIILESPICTRHNRHPALQRVTAAQMVHPHAHKTTLLYKGQRP